MWSRATHPPACRSYSVAAEFGLRQAGKSPLSREKHRRASLGRTSESTRPYIFQCRTGVALLATHTHWPFL
jgi:hypothetical protein